MDRVRPKYQVFVSSTFADLSEAREAVTWTVLELRHIPAGMENFSAANDRGWEIIKRVIDQSDYYILLLAGKYGSTRDDGMSWTAAEYEYAVARGVPVLAFIRNPAAITGDHMDVDSEKVRRLEEFKTRVKDSHLCAFWNSPADLRAKVATALTKHVADDEDDGRPRPGWIRGDKVPGPQAIEELARLTKLSDELRGQVAALQLRADQPTVQRTLEALSADRRKRVRFAGTVVGYDDRGRPIALFASDGNHGNLEGLEDHGVRLSLDSFRTPLDIQRFLGGETVVTRTFDVPGGRPLLVPWDLVRAAWPDSTARDLLHLDIAAGVIWDGARWVLQRE